MYFLTVTHGPDRGKKIQLEDGQRYVVGSNPDAALPLEDPKVLDGHCSIRITAGEALLENHTASAGTWMGDKKIDRVRLQPNVSFRIGDTRLRFSAVAQTRRHKGPAPDDPLIGKVIGGYKINEVVGAGGMGTVYKATQLSLHRDVALKVLRPKLAKDKAFLDLFVAEARAAAQLVDPNIVQVYDAGTEGAVSYFAMEFIGHGSVEELLERDASVAWEEAILMILEAAHGLLYAEGKGIVHRDIKPDNLMINEDGRIKIADLGLAKRGEGAKDEGIIGTPHFIPPEQALGKEVDIRADIYSLGATFFRMITGRTVFSGKTAKEIVLKHIKEPPPAASSIDSDIPDELDAALATMLAKQPGSRYGSVQELIGALETICANYGIKGSIIKKGIPKRVLIPVAILALGAVGVAIHFATKDPETIVNRAAEIRARELEKKQKQDQERIAAQDRALRKSKSDGALGKLQLAAAKLPPIEETYDERDRAAVREQDWLAVAKDYDEYAQSKLAKEFGNDIAARKAADTIRADLKSHKSVQQNKRDWIDAQAKRAAAIETAQRTRLAELRANRSYGDALNLVDRLGSDKPVRGDPFHEIEKAAWVSPIDKRVKVPARRVQKIMKVIADTRENMRKERTVIVREAANHWAAVETQARALSEQENPPAGAVRKLIEAAGEIAQRFPATKGPTPKDLGKITRKARRLQADWETYLRDRQAKRLAQDRLIVRNILRKQRSRDPGSIPNLVMNCEIAAAIEAWQQRLDRNQIQTERYLRFARERIEMLRWVDYLFWRFHEDTRASIADKAAGPFQTLKFEMLGEGRRPHTDLFQKPPDALYKFAFQKRVKGSKERGFGQMPMDWVYHACFHFQGAPRWRRMTPVLEFALGIFCMETMQYDLALPHFEKLQQDPRYGAAAKVLRTRAQAEAAALAEYLAIQSVLTAEEVKAAQVQAALKQLDSFHTRHERTLFYLDVMRLRDPIREDFDAWPVPDLPSAPPSR